MVTLSNSPSNLVTLRLQARKSFALGIWIQDKQGRQLDITDTTLTLVVRKLRFSATDDSDNLVTNSVAEPVSPELGYARFYLQATDLDHKPGEYEFTITMIEEGFSAVMVQGIIDLEQNTEFSALDQTYEESSTSSNLLVKLADRHAFKIQTGSDLAPGTTSFTDEDKRKLDTIEEGAEVNVSANWAAEVGEPGFIDGKPVFGTAAFADLDDIIPAGGSQGAVLTKKTFADGDYVWAQPSGGGGGGSGLDPTGVPEDWVPTSNGGDTWDWKPQKGTVESVNGHDGHVTLSADDIPDGATHVTMTYEERNKLADIDGTVQWDNVQDKPEFGSAALLEEEEVLRPLQVSGFDITEGQVPSEHLPRIAGINGYSIGTASPSGGQDGDLYIQYSV